MLGNGILVAFDERTKVAMVTPLQIRGIASEQIVKLIPQRAAVTVVTVVGWAYHKVGVTRPRSNT